MNIEQTFGIEFDEEDLNIYDWDSIEDLFLVVNRKINGAVIR